MISVIITAFNEPNVNEAIDSVLNQNIDEDYELIVAAPDKQTEDLVKRYREEHKQVKYFKDPGKGKSFALNLLFKEVKGDILILTDGDLILDKDSISEILKVFEDENVGCVSGRPISTNPKDNMLGYWSHLLYDAGAHRIRKEKSENGQFLECTGYLFAFRNNGIVKDIPMDVAEDSIIPYYFWKNGYKVKYAEDAKVYVQNPDNLKDFIKQRKRAGAGSHSKLKLHEPDFPKMKSFINEIKKGSVWALSYPKSIKEFVWTLCLFPTRLYIWVSYYYDWKFKKKGYQDGWEKAESTR